MAAQLATASLASFVLQALGAALVFLSEVVLARALQPDGYGVFAAVTAWMQVLTMVALLGSNHLLLRFVPAYLSTENWSLLRGLLRQCGRGSLMLSLAIAVVGSVGLAVFGNHLAPAWRWAFIIALTILPLHVASVQRQSILRGLHKVSAALSPEYVVRPLILILLAAGLTWGLDVSLTAAAAVGLNAAAIAVAFSLGWYFQRRALPVAVTEARPETCTSEWLKIAVPLFLIAGMQLLIVRMDIMLLAALSGGEEAGVYAAASRIADLAVFALAAANAIVAPLAAGLYARGDLAGMQRMLRLLAKGVAAITVPLVVMVVAFGDQALAIFGSGYQAGYTALLILVLGQTVNALAGPVDFLLYMTGHQMQSLRILALATLMNLSLNVMLIPEYGLLGAAVATASTTIFWNAAMRFAVLKHLGVEASVLVLFRNGLRTR